MPLRQGYIVRGQKPTLRYGAQIRAQARRLPEMYALEESREYREKQFDLSKKGLALEQEGLEETKRQAKEAERVAKGGLALKAGLGGAGLLASRGFFDKAGSNVKGLFGGTKAVDSHSDIYEAGGTMRKAPSLRSQALTGLGGGITGGATAAGLTTALGAKKKWQKAAAGAGGGLLASFLAGGTGPLSLGMGGLLGGGIGALL